jgi:hypothetical protein
MSERTPKYSLGLSVLFGLFALLSLAACADALAG